MNIVDSNPEAFWRLSQAAHMANQPEELAKIGGEGYAYVLKVTVLRAVRYDVDMVVRITREARDTIEPNGHMDLWRDGYVAGCDKAIHLLQGGV